MSQRVALSTKRRFRVLERDRFTCRYCGATGVGVRLEVDHVHPVSKGGGNELRNLVTACRTCNQGKRARLIQTPPSWGGRSQPEAKPAQVTFERRRYLKEDHRVVKDRLTLYWEPNYSTMSDGYYRDEVSALDMLHMWASKVGRTDVPIYWYVCGDVVKVEAAPGRPWGTELGCFTDFYTHPRRRDGSLIRWRGLPVEDLAWRGDYGAPAAPGFIQEATEWKPYPYQSTVHVGDILALASELPHD